MRVKMLMEKKELNTRDLVDETGLAYNTVLAYRRTSNLRLSTEVITSLAEALGVYEWDLFYTGELDGAARTLAGMLGVELPEVITGADIKRLIEKAIVDLRQPV